MNQSRAANTPCRTSKFSPLRQTGRPILIYSDLAFDGFVSIVPKADRARFNDICDPQGARFIQPCRWLRNRNLSVVLLCCFTGYALWPLKNLCAASGLYSRRAVAPQRLLSDPPGLLPPPGDSGLSREFLQTGPATPNPAPPRRAAGPVVRSRNSVPSTRHMYFLHSPKLRTGSAVPLSAPRRPAHFSRWRRSSTLPSGASAEGPRLSGHNPRCDSPRGTPQGHARRGHAAFHAPREGAQGPRKLRKA